jgi:TetR/AcrR family transcriptional regulator, regulator of cefoperazone and chloramphenicol sensitivity
MAQAAKHRYAADGGSRRGRETRLRIISAAIKVFAERGFKGASTRGIATRAGVNAPALQYYFYDKEGVYLACVEHIVSAVWDHLADVVERAERAVALGAGDEELIEAFCDIQAHLAEFMFTAPSSDDRRRFIARQHAGAGPAAGLQIIDQRVSKRMSAVTSAIVGQILGRPARDEETLTRTMMLNSQLMALQVASGNVLTKLDLNSMNAGQFELIKRVLREQTVALLRWMSASRVAASAGREPSGRR